jgi:hypothetical protein
LEDTKIIAPKTKPKSENFREKNVFSIGYTYTPPPAGVHKLSCISASVCLAVCAFTTMHVLYTTTHSHGTTVNKNAAIMHDYKN